MRTVQSVDLRQSEDELHLEVRGEGFLRANEIEGVVVKMPGVLEAAAIGIPDEKSGEVVKLFVVRSDPSVTEEDVEAWCREELTGYKIPKAIEFRDELPKTNVGKILRRELREEELAKREAAAAAESESPE